MLILAAETSTKHGSVAIAQDRKILGEVQSFNQKSHSDVLHGLIDKLLKYHGKSLADVGVFACGKGPGSFTGIRIAGNAFKGFSYALNKPMVAADSLTLMAEAFPENGMICPWINAYKNMVYFARFKKTNGALTTVAGPAVTRVQDLDQHIQEPMWILGDGFEIYKDYLPASVQKNILRPGNSDFDFPRASTLAMHAFTVAEQHLTIDWKTYQPLYIRASEAEETKKGILFTSLK